MAYRAERNPDTDRIMDRMLDDMYQEPTDQGLPWKKARRAYEEEMESFKPNKQLLWHMGDEAGHSRDPNFPPHKKPSAPPEEYCRERFQVSDEMREKGLVGNFDWSGQFKDVDIQYKIIAEQEACRVKNATYFFKDFLRIAYPLKEEDMTKVMYMRERRSSGVCTTIDVRLQFVIPKIMSHYMDRIVHGKGSIKLLFNVDTVGEKQELSTIRVEIDKNKWISENRFYLRRDVKGEKSFGQVWTLPEGQTLWPSLFPYVVNMHRDINGAWPHHAAKKHYENVASLLDIPVGLVKPLLQTISCNKRPYELLVGHSGLTDIVPVTTRFVISPSMDADRLNDDEHTTPQYFTYRQGETYSTHGLF